MLGGDDPSSIDVPLSTDCKTPPKTCAVVVLGVIAKLQPLSEIARSHRIGLSVPIALDVGIGDAIGSVEEFAALGDLNKNVSLLFLCPKRGINKRRGLSLSVKPHDLGIQFGVGFHDDASISASKPASSSIASAPSPSISPPARAIVVASIALLTILARIPATRIRCRTN